MIPLTILQKITIGAVCEAYSLIDIKKSGLWGGGQNIPLPRKIYCVRKSIENTYDLDTTESYLEFTTNFLIALCGNYYLKANNQMNPGGIVPGVIPPSGINVTFPIKVTGSDFEADGVTYINQSIVGYNIMIYVANYDDQWHFAPTDLQYTASGFIITIPGFNANNFLYILISNYTIN